MATVNLNKLASGLIGEKTKVRLRVRDGVVQILPTDRVKGSNLPVGELLVELRTKGTGTKRFTLPKDIEMPVGRFRAIEGKHHWISLTAISAEELNEAVKPGQAKPAGGSVAAK